MTHISFTDQRALTHCEDKCGKRNTARLTVTGPRVWQAMQAFGNAPFHVDQLIVIDTTLDRATIHTVIQYINHGPDLIYIESKRYAAKQRWLVHYGDKSALQVRAMMHRHKSRRARRAVPLDFDITDL